ncbi:MAG: DUF1501 domain-containing protein [Armatimonadetes bacterium]|nr:DUF1501 domain-containing protein [Armatimonadota bacterium]
MQCRRYQPAPRSRRALLQQTAAGFGLVALNAILAEAAAADTDSLEPRPGTHRRRARSVIFLYMDGGPSQVDTFDPKPRLDREHGRPIGIPVPATQFDNVGKVLRSPWPFRQHGQSGIPVSALFPEIATCVDDLAVVRSMSADFSEHTNANYFLHSGHGLQGRPSMGSWFSYGLGTECRDLPSFLVLHSGMIPPGGVDCFHSGFLSAAYQGSLFRTGDEPVADLKPGDSSGERQRSKLSLLRKLDREVSTRGSGQDRLEAAIANYELAFRMQTAVPDLMDLKQESPATQRLYGLDDPVTELYGRQCLIARRLVERGVRFIELLCPNVGTDRWDQHSNLRQGHEKNARTVDRPIAGLLRDLKSRGLLDETLVVWAGEFGRTPMAQGTNGRDHNPFGFSIWLAGGGVRGGTIFGATDEYGYYAVENKMTIHDLHATMLHLLGVDHKRLTYRFSGRDMRLTDVYGEVPAALLA